MQVRTILHVQTYISSHGLLNCMLLLTGICALRARALAATAQSGPGCQAACCMLQVCPTLDILVPALVEGGIDELEKRCTLTPGLIIGNNCSTFTLANMHFTCSELCETRST